MLCCSFYETAISVFYFKYLFQWVVVMLLLLSNIHHHQIPLLFVFSAHTHQPPAKDEG